MVRGYKMEIYKPFRSTSLREARLVYDFRRPHDIQDLDPLASGRLDWMPGQCTSLHCYLDPLASGRLDYYIYY